MQGRSLADLSDRHYALFANNQHPLQLATYQSYNEFLKTIHNQQASALDEAMADRLQEVVDQREATLDKKNGEKLSIDEITEIYIQVKGEFREQNNMALTTRDKKGDIADYLESRRPFGQEVKHE